MASLGGKKRSLPLSSYTSRKTDLGLDKYRICLSGINRLSSKCYSSNGEELVETQWYVFNIWSSGEDCLSLEIERLNKLLQTADRCRKFGVRRVVEDVVKKEEGDKEHQ
ncbi:hypothetical protein RHMOL_Rhmol05G0066200 [Rhododendron molle]|uniref:Uncharacterized protein n=1 Tax=Rhododendron molle TaxID=49168 RepID=A0ACC0NLA6_RHOML|nr:hypothetical protein RHMOL_Rhmol05G0066200 [Rhododendron molle]